MIKIGVICEYNLFHYGHLLQINKIRARFGGCVIIAVMSGSFVQRGEPAALPKYVRARAAVLSGVDIVLELPYPWCCSVAERFAMGGVSILNAAGCDYICFGSESGDIDYLTRVTDNIESGAFKSALDRAVKANATVPYPRLRSEVYSLLFGEALPDRPNDILAVEYLRAIKSIGAKILPFVIKREGGYTATETRRAFEAGEPLDGLVPETAGKIFGCEAKNDEKPFDGALLYALRRLNAPKSDLARRIRAKSHEAVSRAQLYSLCASQSYTDARIRREAIALFCGTEEYEAQNKPLFTVLLAAGAESTYILKEINGIAAVTKPADYHALPGEARGQFERSLAADNLYSLIRNEPPCQNLRRTPFISPPICSWR